MKNQATARLPRFWAIQLSPCTAYFPKNNPGVAPRSIHRFGGLHPLSSWPRNGIVTDFNENNRREARNVHGGSLWKVPEGPEDGGAQPGTGAG